MQKRGPETKKSKSIDNKERTDFEPELVRRRKFSKDQGPKVLLRLGVCAMRKKIEAKPMQQILNRLKCPEFQIIIIDDVYWDKSYKTWPEVDALMCFYSKGFPYMKAWKYVQATQPFLINDLDKQQMLWDRTLVYNELKRHNIPTARHFFVCRNQDSIQQFYKQRYCDLDQDQDFTTYKVQLKNVLQKVVTPPPVLSPDRNSDSSDGTNLTKKQSQNQRRKNSSIDLSESIEIFHNLPSFEQTRPQKQVSSSRFSDSNYVRNPITILQSYFDRISYEDYSVKELDDDSIMIGTHKLKKPFIQKPFDAENHQVCIYYPEADGGGCKFLYRKNVNTSSQFNPKINSIRTKGSYVYEEFLRTNGFDIKVYAVGPYYMHAEARKAPSLDGVVQRNEMGKQKRYPVVLTPEQKFISQKIVQVFKQYVCGFDLLRANGKTYVCDVNGWSFVKGNSKYFDDCASILKQVIFKKFFPQKINEIAFSYGNFRNIIQNRFVPTTQQMLLESNAEQLRSIVAIFRHGQRSPKQKMKLTVDEPAFLSFFKGDVKEVKLKDSKSLTTLLNITNEILGNMQYQISQRFLKLVQMKSVLQTGGHFDGLSRKIQLKPAQFGPHPKNPNKKVVTKAILILKWGGCLTNAGQIDALQLGKYYRSTYSDQQGFLSLHSSYRHDLNTYSSDEGRCLQTSAAFLKGFLDLEGDLSPIINSMVIRDKKAQHLLDMGDDAKQARFQQSIINQQISQILNSSQSVQSNLSKKYNLKGYSNDYLQAIKKLQNPRKKLQQLFKLVKALTSSIAQFSTSYYINAKDIQSKPKLVGDENSQVLIYKRWYKHEKDLYNSKTDVYNISKIPEIYDSIRYDILHNSELLEKNFPKYNDLYQAAETFAYFVVPSQFGISVQSKLSIGQKMVAPLCKKIYNDLMFWKGDKSNQQQQYWKYKEGINKKQWKHVRTRLYFTSSSHLNSLFNVLSLGNNGALLKSCESQVVQRIKQINYIGFLSHIQLRLYQNLKTQLDDKNRFRLQLNFSPQYDASQNPNLNLMVGHSAFTIDQIETFFKTLLDDQWSKIKTQ